MEWIVAWLSHLVSFFFLRSCLPTPAHWVIITEWLTSITSSSYLLWYKCLSSCSAVQERGTALRALLVLELEKWLLWRDGEALEQAAREVTELPSLKVFEKCVDVAHGWWGWVDGQIMISEAFSNLNHSVILWKIGKTWNRTIMYKKNLKLKKDSFKNIF